MSAVGASGSPSSRPQTLTTRHSQALASQSQGAHQVQAILFCHIVLVKPLHANRAKIPNTIKSMYAYFDISVVMQSSSGNSSMIPTGAFHHRKCPISLLMDPTLLKPSHNNSIGNAGGDATSLRTSCRIEIMKQTRSLSQHPVAAVCHTALSLTDVHKLSTEPPKSTSGNIHFICSLRFSQLGGI